LSCAVALPHAKNADATTSKKCNTARLHIDRADIRGPSFA
jgi:hypothetical protein